MFSWELTLDLELDDRTVTDKLEEFERMTDLAGTYLDREDPWEGFQVRPAACI